MRSVIQSIFGVYSPLFNEDGTFVEGLAGVDWEYIAGVFLFGVVLISFFKIVGAVLKR